MGNGLAADSGLTLRAITEADRAFLLRLYKSTRELEMSLLPWPPEQIEVFLAQQFHAQQTHYSQQYPEAKFQIIEQNGSPVGRLTLDDRPTGLHIIEMALLPEYRNQGIGSTLIQAIFSEAQASGKTVSLSVKHDNPALSLYHRLGFKIIQEHAPYSFMEWTPDESVA